jgi:hypothetical protein
MRNVFYSQRDPHSRVDIHVLRFECRAIWMEIPEPPPEPGLQIYLAFW